MIYNMTTISVILVTGGSHGVGLASVELLHTNGSHLCSLPDLPSYRRGHSQTGVTLCGGFYSPDTTSCHTLSSTGSWELSHNLAQGRADHSAWASPQGIMLIGGYWRRPLETTEILLKSGDTKPGFSLNYRTA